MDDDPAALRNRSTVSCGEMVIFILVPAILPWGLYFTNLAAMVSIANARLPAIASLQPYNSPWVQIIVVVALFCVWVACRTLMITDNGRQNYTIYEIATYLVPTGFFEISFAAMLYSVIYVNTR